MKIKVFLVQQKQEEKYVGYAYEKNSITFLLLKDYKVQVHLKSFQEKGKAYAF